MLVSGIIAEYNPMHNGHKYHIDMTKKAGTTHIVTVISGNYVQRGDLSIISKHSRAKMALHNGADLVLELPTPWSMSTAQNFAYGSVSILKSLGVVDNISFGCENNNIKLLKKASEAVYDSRIKYNLDKSLSKGLSFATARELAVKEIYGTDVSSILSKPNNTLAVEYIAAIKNLNADINIMGIERFGAIHDMQHAGNGNISSASYIRNLIFNDDINKAYTFMPNSAAVILADDIKNGYIANIKNLENAILAKLRTMNPDDFYNIPDVSEGLHNRIYSFVRTSTGIDELYDNIKTKRYTHARIRRLILSSFLGIDKNLFMNPVPYIKVLGFNKKGLEILQLAKTKVSVPLVINIKDIKQLDDKGIRLFKSECISTDLYNLSFIHKKPCGSEYTEEVITV